MSETPETIRAKFQLSMFLTNDAYLRGQITLEQCQSRLLGLKNAMTEELDRFEAIQKTHKTKKRVESPYE